MLVRHRLSLALASAWLAGGALLCGCPGQTGDDGGTAGCNGQGEPGVAAGFTGLSFDPIEEGDTLPAWTRPQGGIGTRLNVRATGFTVDADWEIVRIIIAGATEDPSPGPGELGGACREEADTDAGVLPDGGEVEPPPPCDRPYVCDDDNTCVFRIANVGYSQYPTPLCLDDGSVMLPEIPIRFRTFLFLEDVDGALSELTVEIETGDGEVLSQTTRVTLEESEFIDPETFDPL